MKTKYLLTALLALPLSAGVARATIYDYSQTGLTTDIPDGSTVGITASQTVSDIPTAGGGDIINNVDVTLNISGGYNGDLYGYLVLQSVDGSTTTSILLNRVGTTATDSFGADGSGFNVTLTGGATDNLGDPNSGDIHIASETTGSALTGVYLADGRAVSPLTVTDTSSRTAGLDVFNSGIEANGTWTLFLADLSAGGQSQLNSWGLSISVVPEPVTAGMIVFGSLVGLGALISLKRRHHGA